MSIPQKGGKNKSKPLPAYDFPNWSWPCSNLTEFYQTSTKYSNHMAKFTSKTSEVHQRIWKSFGFITQNCQILDTLMIRNHYAAQISTKCSHKLWFQSQFSQLYGKLRTRQKDILISFKHKNQHYVLIQINIQTLPPSKQFKIKSQPN